MPRGEFKHRYWFFADTPNIAGICRVIWKDLLWSSDSYRLLKYRGGCKIPLFQLSVWCEKCVAARHYDVICKQILISNDRNRVRWIVLGLSEDGACTDFSEHLSVNNLKGDLSNATTSNPPFFSLSIPLMYRVPTECTTVPGDDCEAEWVNILPVCAKAHLGLAQSDGVLTAGHSVILLQLSLQQQQDIHRYTGSNSSQAADEPGCDVRD
jgi:hypothetical protein